MAHLHFKINTINVFILKCRCADRKWVCGVIWFRSGLRTSRCVGSLGFLASASACATPSRWGSFPLCQVSCYFKPTPLSCAGSTFKNEYLSKLYKRLLDGFTYFDVRSDNATARCSCFHTFSFGLFVFVHSAYLRLYVLPRVNIHSCL